tara:strand:- start:191 stop:694 length:504 start_codon:yes stop_codon:yes gene_type:complete
MKGGKMSFKKLLTALFIGIVVAGCSTTSNIDLVNQDSMTSNFSVNSVTAKNESGQSFEIDIESLLETAVNQELSKQGLSNRGGPSYALQVSIIQYKEGNAFARWMMPGMGKTVLSVEAILTNETGVAVAQSQATRSIGAGGGYTINAWSRVFNQVAEQLVEDLASVR